jgi:hypothetical protein
MELVNQTNPAHFKNHVYYSSLRFDPGCNIERYVKAQFNHSEFRYLNLFFLLLALSGAIAAISDWKNVFSIRFLLIMFSGYHLSQLHHCFSHFGQDISFFAGNIMHHSDTSRFVDESNASFVDTVPQGFAITIILTVTWACIVRSLIANSDPVIKRKISWKSLFASNVICGFIVARQVKVDHPLIHQLASTAMESAMPFTWNFIAYKHVYGHHVTGGERELIHWIITLYKIF